MFDEKHSKSDFGIDGVLISSEEELSKEAACSSSTQFQSMASTSLTISFS